MTLYTLVMRQRERTGGISRLMVLSPATPELAQARHWAALALHMARRHYRVRAAEPPERIYRSALPRASAPRRLEWFCYDRESGRVKEWWGLRREIRD